MSETYLQNRSHRISNTILRAYHYLIGTGLGLGFSPIAPGTAGSLLGLPLGLWLLTIAEWQVPIVLLGLYLVFVYSSQKLSQHLGKGDPGLIVCDEVLGQAIALLGLRRVVAHSPFLSDATNPSLNEGLATGSELLNLSLSWMQNFPGLVASARLWPSWEWIVGAFVLFRVFDIIKPFPAKTFDRRHDGWGIMTDDVVAGLYSALALWGLSRVMF